MATPDGKKPKEEEEDYALVLHAYRGGRLKLCKSKTGFYSNPTMALLMLVRPMNLLCH